MSPRYGLHYIHLGSDLVELPVLNVRAEASIKELAARVKLIQTYRNNADHAIEPVYCFPVPARAAVCSFAMTKQDGTRVVGRVLEKDEAKKTYDAAVEKGVQASLMERQYADVFQVSVGNIPPGEEVKIELVYATELSEDEENDSIRFHLPAGIGARYGQAPASDTAFKGTPFLNVAIAIEAVAPISKITCISHTVSTELGPDPTLPNFKDLPFSHYARVSLISEAQLDKDFVLTVKSAGLDAPRCIAELHPTHDTVALSLTLVPRFTLPDLRRQEFIILVDRSGSMSGARIAAARRALVIMLRGLPHADTLFQIASFGDRTSALWPDGSKPYNQQTLQEATKHVDGMKANYGGTEIRAALQYCVAKRCCDRSTSILVLTDGDAWDIPGVLEAVKTAVDGAPADAPIRMSVLGIGNMVSTGMCEGIARVGHGACILVGEEETSFTGKIARLLKAARTPIISNVAVDWGRPVVEEAELGGDFEIVEAPQMEPQQPATLNLFVEDIDPTIFEETVAPPAPPVVLPPPSAVQQSPFKIRTISPGIRLNVYAILQGQSVPEAVILHGSTAEGAKIELRVPVSLSRLPSDPTEPSSIHALAARKIIQDLEDGNHPFLQISDAGLRSRTVKASIVRLGTTYSIASIHTSFVAVDESQPEVLAGVPSVLEEEEEQSDDDMGFGLFDGGPSGTTTSFLAGVDASSDDDMGFGLLKMTTTTWRALPYPPLQMPLLLRPRLSQRTPSRRSPVFNPSTVNSPLTSSP
ncbi:von Willebrand factor type A domain-containing protein [Roridomyces roridus]|uniref:von Willebrand factor type A domain-containing protein n=1 Tax=Roridomyces roridus TaxID=1738132 RepID=A0AAD7C1Z5_9AGAR|nr:von Willebrand factor type A domain-containing protein [Roridomyces roridus]